MALTYALFSTILLSSPTQDERASDAQIAAAAAKSPMVSPALLPSAAKFSKIDLAPTLFRLNDDPYVAVRFKAPMDVAQRRLAWGFSLPGMRSWYILGLDEPMTDGFSSFQREGGFICQTLDGALLKPGQTYALWFRLTHPREPQLTYSLTLFPKALLVSALLGKPPAIAGLKAARPFEVTPASTKPVDPNESPDLPAIRDLVGALSAGSDEELARRKRKAELGKTIPDDVKEALMKFGTVRTLKVNSNPAQSAYIETDLTDMTFRHRGKTYAAVMFTPTKPESPAPDMTYSFHLPSCDAFGVMQRGPQVIGEHPWTFVQPYLMMVPEPPAKASDPLLITGTLPAFRGEGPAPPWIMWFRFDETVKPLLRISLNWFSEDQPILPLLGPKLAG